MRIGAQLSGALSNGWAGSPNSFWQITNEGWTQSTLTFQASGLAVNAISVALTLDTTSLGSVTPVDNRWTANLLSLSASNHTLAATATFTNGQAPGTATSSFTVAGTNGVTNYFDAAGYVTNRVFYHSNKVQQLSWDGLGHLVSVVERDYLTNGYNWSAIYDATGRRLRTVNVPVNGGTTNVAATLAVDSYYDPQIKFSEIGVGVDGVRTWKVLGPDITGSCGGMHGVGGLEATVLETDGTTVPVLNDSSGNVLATIGTGGVTWNPIRVGAYGPVSGYRPETVGPGTVLAETLVWRSRWMDPSGLYCLGARYYDPVGGHFLAPDPLGHAASMDLYSFCSGDPCNSFDPSGRLSSTWNAGTQNTTPNIYMGVEPIMQSYVQTTRTLSDGTTFITDPWQSALFNDNDVGLTSHDLITAPTGQYGLYVSQNPLPDNYGLMTTTPIDPSQYDILIHQDLQFLKADMWFLGVMAGLPAEGALVDAFAAETTLATETGASSAAQGAMLQQQLAAEEAAGAQMPESLTGYLPNNDYHGLDQAISRPGRISFLPQAGLDVHGKTGRISRVQSNGRFPDGGPERDLSLSIRKARLLLTWATSSAGLRIIP